MTIARFLGCLLGGAYGDSLGAAVEFLPLAKIREKYGERGIVRLDRAFDHAAGVITDDTQMALATAKGVLAVPGSANSNDDEILASLWGSYREWVRTQDRREERRSPGMTCIASLCGDFMGTPEAPLNESAGCGGIMRVHPIGLAFCGNFERAFDLGMKSAALTHGDPNGYVPAGAMAAIIASLLSGDSLRGAVGRTLNHLRKLPETMHLGTLIAVERAVEACDADAESIDHAVVIDEQVGGGGGWCGHDALAIALYSAMVSPNDPLEAVRIAVNHSGDSDSTGSITGAIVGAIFGPDAFLRGLAVQGAEIERQEEIAELGRGLFQWSERRVA